MADLVGTTTQQQMLAKLDQIISGLSDMSSFSLLHVRDFITYLIITLLVALLELAMFIVIGFGYLALGAVLVIGPILIPFMIVPKLDFLFWSWLKALIKYSFYPVIGNIVLLGICQIMLSILNTTLPTAGQIVITVTQIPILIIVFAAGLYAIFKIPSLVGDIFSGAANAGERSSSRDYRRSNECPLAKITGDSYAMNSSSTRKPELPTIPAKSDAEFQAGKRLYAEQWGDAVVTNTYLETHDSCALSVVRRLALHCLRHSQEDRQLSYPIHPH